MKDPRVTRVFSRFFQRWIWPLRAIFVVVAFWQIASTVGLINPIFLPTPTVILEEFFSMLASGELLEHIAISLQRAFSGFLLAVVTAVPLGVLIGRFRKIESFLDPLTQFFRQTSAMALFPVFILFFGIGEVSKVAIVFWAAQWPILLNTISGVKNVDSILIKSARSMAVSEWSLLGKVILPAAVPNIITGLRLSATHCVLVLVSAEMVGAKSGLGFLVINTQYTFEVTRMYAAILTLAFLGLIINYTLVGIEKRVTRWKDPGVAL